MTKRLFNGVTGLNTVVDPVRVPYDYKAGVSDLSVAVNIDIDQSGRPSRRQGYSLAQAGNFHSLFCDGGDCYVCKDTSLYQVGTDLSITGVRSGLSGDTIRYCSTPKGVLYSDGTYNGILQGNNSSSWPVDTYIGPDTNRNFVGAPVGSHLAFYRGRVFIADGPVLWNSEPYQYGLFDKSKGFNQFESDVIMVAPVIDGLFVSTRNKTYFMRGVPGEFTLETVANYPAIEDSLAIDSVEGMEVGLQNPGLCRVWASTEGAVLGTSSGQVINLNKDKVIYDESLAKGAGTIRGYEYIHNMY